MFRKRNFIPSSVSNSALLDSGTDDSSNSAGDDKTQIVQVANTQGIVSKILPVQITSSIYQSSITFSSEHRIPVVESHQEKQGSFGSFFHLHPDHVDKLSKLLLQVTKLEDGWYLNILCEEYSDLFSFDLKPLLGLFPDQHRAALIEKTERTLIENRLLTRKNMVSAEELNGVKLDNNIHAILDELAKHEGHAAGDKKWMPNNSMKLIREEFEKYLPAGLPHLNN